MWLPGVMFSVPPLFVTIGFGLLGDESVPVNW